MSHKQQMEAIDWTKILELLDKAGPLSDLFKKIIELFKQPAPMQAKLEAEHCPSECMCECLAEQEKDILNALLHNYHMQQCCKPDEPKK